jgi:hypothetical protein
LSFVSVEWALDRVFTPFEFVNGSIVLSCLDIKKRQLVIIDISAEHEIGGIESVDKEHLIINTRKSVGNSIFF